MKTVPTTGGLLLAVALLAGCSERSPTTAPVARPAALAVSGFIGDRPYTWTLKCQATGSANVVGWVDARWGWDYDGVRITETSQHQYCSGDSTVSGSGVRPDSANGFSACVWSGGICKRWTFDPSGSFKAQLKGSYTYCIFDGCVKTNGTLSIES